MTIQSIDPRIPAVATDGTTPLTPDQIVEQLRVLREHIPNFGPLPVPDSRALRTTASLHPQFIEASITIVGASPHIAGAVEAKGSAMLTERDDIGRWGVVEGELRAMLTGLAASNLSRRHRLGLTALQAYAIGRQLVRKKAHADLLPMVEDLRRANRLGKKRAPEQPAKPEPAPVAPPVVPVKTS